MARNYYEILEVKENASIEEIKSSYKRLVKKYHPDISKVENAEKIFKEINEAFDTLSDEVKKLKYDTLNGIMPNSKEEKEIKKEAKKENKTEEKKEPPKKKRENFGDFVNKFFEEKESKPRPTKGENINMTIEITPKEAIDGVVKKINIVHSEKCPKCLGKKFANGTKCTNCDGSGEITIRKKVTVRIPKNPKQNSTLKIKNEGKLGKFGAESGDLILTIKIASKNVFKIENNRAKLELPITPWEAFLGSDILIPTMDGNVTMKIPPQTNSHDKFKITGGGPLNKKTGKREDLIVEIKIVTPQKPTIEEIRAYKEIKNLDGSKIRNELFE
ncbi:DnaJ domain-containing protein [bacterium]|nr:DnaJ domain-containing protein [bacterium]